MYTELCVVWIGKSCCYSRYMQSGTATTSHYQEQSDDRFILFIYSELQKELDINFILIFHKDRDS